MRPGLPPIQVSPPQGKLLALLVEVASAARDVLEFGTLGWLQHDLDRRGRCPPGWSADHPRGRSSLRGGRSAPTRAARVSPMLVEDPDRPRAGEPAGAEDEARARSTSSSSTPTRSTRRSTSPGSLEHTTPGGADRRRQRRPRRRPRRSTTPRTQRSMPSAASTRCSPPSRGRGDDDPDGRRPRATTASRSPWSGLAADRDPGKGLGGICTSADPESGAVRICERPSSARALIPFPSVATRLRAHSEAADQQPSRRSTAWNS